MWRAHLNELHINIYNEHVITLSSEVHSTSVTDSNASSADHRYRWKFALAYPSTSCFVPFSNRSIPRQQHDA